MLKKCTNEMYCGAFTRITLLATPHTPKNTGYDRKHMVKKLGQLADSVAARGVYVVRKNQVGQWDLYDHIKHLVILDNLPDQDIAERIARKYNNSKHIQFSELHHKISTVCNRISKHTTDCVHYVHTLQQTTDAHKTVCIKIKLQHARYSIRYLTHKLSNMV